MMQVTWTKAKKAWKPTQCWYAQACGSVSKELIKKKGKMLSRDEKLFCFKIKLFYMHIEREIYKFANWHLWSYPEERGPSQHWGRRIKHIKLRSRLWATKVNSIVAIVNGDQHQPISTSIVKWKVVMCGMPPIN